MDTKTLMMLAGGGLLVYFMTSKPVLAAPEPGAGGGAGGGGTPTPPAPKPPDPVAPAFNSLAAVYQRLLSVAGGAGVNPATGTTPDGWNFYLMQPTVSTIANPPDPLVVFPGIDRSKNMTAVQYWTGMSAYLGKNNGMSGMHSYYPRSRFFAGGGWHA